jgi:hypothetical protein
MAIIKTIEAPNGATVQWHRVSRVEYRRDGAFAVVLSFANQARLDASGQPSWQWTVGVAPVVAAGNVVDLAEAHLIADAASPFVGGYTAPDSVQELSALKRRKSAEINAARLAANRSTFTFTEKAIACDELSRGDIDAINGIVTLTGALPPGWPGAWKAVDNTYVVIGNVATWGAFYGAMVAQGMANFGKSQTLKATLDAATTAEEVAAVVW